MVVKVKEKRDGYCVWYLIFCFKNILLLIFKINLSIIMKKWVLGVLLFVLKLLLVNKIYFFWVIKKRFCFLNVFMFVLFLGWKNYFGLVIVYDNIVCYCDLIGWK